MNKSTSTMTRVLFWMLIVMLGIHFAALVRWQSAPNISYDVPGYLEYALGEPDVGAVLIPILQAAAAVVLTILFLVWVYQLSRQLHASSDIEMQYSSGWAVASFLVPFVNLFMPFLVMREMWDVLYRGRPRSSGHALLGWWWGLLVFGNLFSTFGRLGGFWLFETWRPAVELSPDLVAAMDIAATVLLLVVVQKMGVAAAAGPVISGDGSQAETAPDARGDGRGIPRFSANPLLYIGLGLLLICAIWLTPGVPREMVWVFLVALGAGVVGTVVGVVVWIRSYMKSRLTSASS